MQLLASVFAIVFGAAVLLSPTQASINGACKVPSASVSGHCINSTSTACCIGYFTANYCPDDPTAVKCCTQFQPCKGVTGTCVDKRYNTCKTAFLNDKCPGGDNVKCCPGDWLDTVTSCKIGH
ncbi:hypothetical protein BKA62DRAFT_725524, partial [Auriculariales sp. MPI-PUGE-AT-0066]